MILRKGWSWRPRQRFSSSTARSNSFLHQIRWQIRSRRELGRRPTFIDGGRHTWIGSFAGSSSWIHGSGTSLVKGSWSCHQPIAGAEGVGVRREDAERSRLPPPRVAPPRVGVERTPPPVDGATIAAIGDDGERHGNGSRRGRCLPPPPSMGFGWGSTSRRRT